MLGSPAIAPCSTALVARTDPASGAERYLVLTPAGQAVWEATQDAATTFPSLREATRMALRLPARERAYGLPRGSELAVSLH